MPYNQLFSLISSLPMLNMQEKPQITAEGFLDAAAVWLQGNELAELKELSLSPKTENHFRAGSFAAVYSAWELALRHSILRLRIQKNRYTDVPAADIPVFECDADAVAIRAYGAGDPLEREYILDRARWEKTEELTVGQTFGTDPLQAYFIRLQIAWKWAKRSMGNPEKNLDAAAENPEKGDNNNDENKQKHI